MKKNLWGLVCALAVMLVLYVPTPAKADVETFTVDKITYEVTDSSSYTARVYCFEIADSTPISIEIPAAVTPAEGTYADQEFSVTDISSHINSSSHKEAVDGLTIPGSIQNMSESYLFSCFSNLASVTFREGVQTIGTDAFAGITNLSTVSLPSTLSEIKDRAFKNCTGLTSIDLPEGLRTIDHGAFEGCTGLTSISFPSDLETIMEAGFKGCTGLTSIDLPDNTVAGTSAFENCTGLTSITFPGKEYICDSVCAGCTNLTTVTISDGAKTISSYAFSGCTKLGAVTIPSSVTHIETSAFYGCTSLGYIRFPGVTTIRTSAFENCTALTDVIIPSSITNIDDHAFAGCSSLTSVTIEAATPPGVAGDPFGDNRNLTIYVPENSWGDYHSAGGVLANATVYHEWNFSVETGVRANFAHAICRGHGTGAACRDTGITLELSAGTDAELRYTGGARGVDIIVTGTESLNGVTGFPATEHGGAYLAGEDVVYYLADGTTRTSSAQGAAAAGKAPKKPGTYVAKLEVCNGIYARLTYSIVVDTWEALNNLIRDAQNGETIKLTKDYCCDDSFEQPLTVNAGQMLTLDLNAYALSAESRCTALRVCDGATLTIIDSSTEKTGRIINGKGTNGGGIDLKGTLYLNGGSISENLASNGAGIYVSGTGTLHMYEGATIKDNVPNGDNSFGAGIYNNGGTVEIYGGAITRNRSNGDGGGIFNSGSLYIYGGSITGNHADGYGGGIFERADATLNIGGSVNVTGNFADEAVSGTHVSSDIHVQDNNSANIHLIITGDHALVTSGDNHAQAGFRFHLPGSASFEMFEIPSEADIDCFSVNNSGYICTAADVGGTLRLVCIPHTHRFTAFGAEGTPTHLYAYCNGGAADAYHCLLYAGSTTDPADATIILTISATSQTYNGSEVTATVTCSVGDDIKTAILGADATITYYTDEDCTEMTTVSGSGAAAEGGAPVSAGTYYAMITTNLPIDTQKTAKVSFTISKADTSAPAQAPTAVTGLTYTGSPLALVSAGDAGLEYALGTETAAGSTWSTTIPTATDAGTYYVWYKVPGDGNHNDFTSSAPTATLIEKATPAAPAATLFTLTAPTSATAADGRINGTDSTMEYSVLMAAGWSDYVAVTGNAITGFAGSIQVKIRYAETATANASADTTVEVPSYEPEPTPEPTPEITPVPQPVYSGTVTLGSNSKGISVVVDENLAVIKGAITDNMDRNGKVTVDLSGIGDQTTVNGVSLERWLLNTISSMGSQSELKVILPESEFTLDRKAMQAISSVDSVGDGKIRISVESGTSALAGMVTSISEEQLAALEGNTVIGVIGANVSVGDTQIHDLQGGTMTMSTELLPTTVKLSRGNASGNNTASGGSLMGNISLKLEADAGKLSLKIGQTGSSKVKHLKDDGTVETLPSSKVSLTDKNGHRLPQINATSLSYFVVVYEEDEAYRPSTAERDMFALNSELSVNYGESSLELTWGKVEAADGYLVYAAYTGKKFSEPVKVIESCDTTSTVIKKLGGKKLNPAKIVKLYVVAYTLAEDGTRVIQGKSLTAYAAGPRNKSLTNATSITVSDRTITLGIGETTKLAAETILDDADKKHLSTKCSKEFTYKSTNPYVAKVNSYGVITAVGTGACDIYVYSPNGCAQKVEVTVAQQTEQETED